MTPTLEWVEAGGRAVIKAAIRRGFRRSGADPDLSTTPPDLLLDLAIRYEAEFQEVAAEWRLRALHLKGWAEQMGNDDGRASADLLLISVVRAEFLVAEARRAR